MKQHYGRIPETGPPLPPIMVHGWFCVSALDLLISISSPIVALCFLATRPQIWKPPGLPRFMHHGMDLWRLLRSFMVGSVHNWADRDWSVQSCFCLPGWFSYRAIPNKRSVRETKHHVDLCTMVAFGVSRYFDLVF